MTVESTAMRGRKLSVCDVKCGMVHLKYTFFRICTKVVHKLKNKGKQHSERIRKVLVYIQFVPYVCETVFLDRRQFTCCITHLLSKYWQQSS